MIRKTVFTAIVCGLFCAAACRREAPTEKTYALKGTIVTVNAPARTAVIKHEKIGDWMEAMTMEFPVKDPAEFAKLKTGEKITATVHTRADTFQYWITNIHAEP